MWTALGEIDRKNLTGYGRKAAELSLAWLEGLALPDSFVLDTSILDRLGSDEELALKAARSLLESMPTVERFLLRSSSSLEDRPESSAAGLFSTLSCAAREEAIASTLRELARSTASRKLHELLRRPAEEKIPLAVLAQPRLELDAWCTVQGGSFRSAWIVEGWRRTIHGRQPLWLQLPVDEVEDSSAAKESYSADATMEGLGGIVSLARAALRRKKGTWLLEIGVEKGRALLLQRRPVATAAPVVESEDPPLKDFPLFPGDETQSWRLDAEHSPMPLCPLLAGVFLEWIRAKGADHPARLIHGRWHERVATPGGGENEVQQAATSSDGENETGRGATSSVEESQAGRAAGKLADALHRWKTQRLPRLREDLGRLSKTFLPLASPVAWPEFTAAWLRWQQLYYDGQSQALRKRARILLDALDRAGPPPLPETIAARRGRELDALARFWRENPGQEEREAALEPFLARHGHHAPGGWDGRAVPWREDPSPLLAELQRRIEETPPTKETPPATPPQALPEWTRLAGEALAALEDDDELLSEAYAAFREAALDLEAWLRPEAETAEILDLLPIDLQALIASPSGEGWERARERGLALSRRWECTIARQNALPAGALAPVTPGDILQGIPLSPGHAEGTVRILPSAQSEGGPRRGEILVLPSVVPSDAVVFSRCGGLICENGSLLSHAAVLAREHGLAAVVLPHARRRLREVRHVRLDGRKGIIEILLLLVWLLLGSPLPPTQAAAFSGKELDSRPLSKLDSLDRSAARIEADLRALCHEGGRIPGSVQFQEALDHTTAQFERAGMAWHLQKVRVHRWEAGQLPVRWSGPDGPSEIERLPALGRSGGFLQGSLPLLDVGYGTPGELRENLLLLPGHVLVSQEGSPPGQPVVHRLQKLSEAAGLGAAGILFVHSGGLQVEGTVAWKGLSKIPAYSLPHGEALHDDLRRGASLQLEAQSQGFLPPALVGVDSFNGIADLRAPRAGEETIVVSAHLDAWDLGEGALDNAAGVAVLLETARQLARFREDVLREPGRQEAAREPKMQVPLRPLRFIVFTGEELGMEGSRAYLEAARRKEEAWPALIVNLEMPEDPAGFVIHAGSSLRAPLRKVLLSYRAWDLSGGVREILDLYSDHLPFVLAGVPSFSLATHRSPGAQTRIHTALDRREKLDPKGLARCAAILASTLAILADPTTPLPARLDEPSIEALFSSQGLDLARVREKGF